MNPEHLDPTLGGFGHLGPPPGDLQLQDEQRHQATLNDPFIEHTGTPNAWLRLPTTDLLTTMASFPAIYHQATCQTATTGIPPSTPGPSSVVHAGVNFTPGGIPPSTPGFLAFPHIPANDPSRIGIPETPTIPSVLPGPSGLPLDATPEPPTMLAQPMALPPPTFLALPNLSLENGKNVKRDDYVWEQTMLRTKIAELEQKIKLECANVDLVKDHYQRKQVETDLTLQAVLKRIEQLENQLSNKLRTKHGRNWQIDALGSDSDSSDSDDSDSGSSDSESDKEVKVKEESEITSEQAMMSRKINEVVGEVFKVFLGTRTWTQESLREWQGEHKKADSELDLISDNDKYRQVRFNFKKTTKQDKENDQKITTLARYAKECGHTYIGGSKALLDAVYINDLKKKFEGKFDALRKIYQGTVKKTKTAGEEAPLDNLTHDNRGMGTWICKRTSKLVPKDKQWVQEEKYDDAFAVTWMSDDDNFYDESGALVADTYLSQAPAWRSDTPIGARWMVDEKWLEENGDYNTEHYIVDNGKKWNEDVDPEDVEELRGTIKDEKKRKRDERKAKSEEAGERKNKKTKKVKNSKGKGRAD
ncbi:hypothetical protein VKT23_014655 [Stygiomarasmius scandens]|uniref:WW domain-containing protein n=1 Tax=Marasmiellus scandens TaxID=2682957 RepID=A0ABR1J4I8_9AGAR